MIDQCSWLTTTAHSGLPITSSHRKQKTILAAHKTQPVG